MPRADQRRWAEIYLRGLLATSGKKSIKNIAGPHASPQELQSLRQFINRSPWPWEPVAERYARLLVAAQAPELWILDSVFIPKRGNASVGAGRWFVRKHGQTMNGQMGMALFLSSRRASVPVAWRILLRDHWVNDLEARDAVGIPDGYQLRHEWEAAIDLIDSEIRARVLPRRPVAADLRHLPDAGRLISELSGRGIEFLVEVDATELPCGCSTAGRPGTMTSMVIGEPRSAAFGAPTRVVTEHPSSAAGERRYWVTNIPQRDMRFVLFSRLVLQRHVVDLARLESHHGTRDFAGRSFGGWHRHLVLASAGFAFSALENARRPRIYAHSSRRLAV